MQLFSDITFLVVVLGTLNLLRMTFLMIGSDLYGLIYQLKRRNKSDYFPSVSVVIPAFNEEKSILASVKSVLASNYPKDKFEVIVVNDGSTDSTKNILEDFAQSDPDHNLNVITQENSGKAHSLNNGIKNFAHGVLIMCLDGDSIITKDTIRNAVRYFENREVMALASNMKIKKEKGLLNLIQRLEYAVSYQMKKAQTVFNIEYIIGGVGSMFRKSILEDVCFYDTNTVTEDIDLTLKILQKGNKKFRVEYASDVIAYTQSALTIKDLIKQRYRWKWGRYQTFLKNRNLFFSRDKKYTKGLSWFYLPYALFSDVILFFEPLLVTYVWFVIFYYHDLSSLLTMVSVVSFYLILNIISEETFSLREKLELIVVVPPMYFLFYILSMVEYIVLVKSWFNMPKLRQSLLKSKHNWKPITRSGFSSS